MRVAKLPVQIFISYLNFGNVLAIASVHLIETMPPSTLDAGSKKIRSLSSDDSLLIATSSADFPWAVAMLERCVIKLVFKMTLSAKLLSQCVTRL